MKDLVSVAIPAHNAAEKIPIALASLLSQDYENWEALVVDDGSIDDTESVVRKCDDPRIRFFRFSENRGRPQAREMALRKARGNFMAMLDADDWWYPEKLSDQMRIFEKKPSLVLVSTGMAITDEQMQIFGVRALGNRHQKWPSQDVMTRPTVPNVAHAPSVIRMDRAQSSSYDPALTVAEDVDYLIKVLCGNAFTVISKPLYAYSEIRSVNSLEILAANRFVRDILMKYFQVEPFWIGKQVFATILKGLVYRMAFSVGLTNWMIARRSRRPNQSETRSFLLARKSVYCSVERYWPGFLNLSSN